MNELISCDRVLLIDGTNMAHRAYFGLKNSPTGLLISPSGEPITVCATVLKSLLMLRRDYRPTHIVVAFDNTEKTYRHRLYPAYKAARMEKDAALVKDLHRLQEILATLKLSLLAPPGFEADDVLASLVHHYKLKPVLVYSGDRDLFGVVDDRCTVLYPSTKYRSTLTITPTEVQSMMGVMPTQIADYKALRGDSIDNIPGVTGIGEKMAVSLLNEYETIEQIYANLGKITGTRYTRLKKGKADAEISKQLALLRTDIPLDIDTIVPFETACKHIDKIAPILQSLGLGAIASSFAQCALTR